MRKSTLMVLALASTTLAASPAAATVDNAGYFGVEAGLWFPSDTDFEFDFSSGYEYDLDTEFDMGFDGDIIGGYDFGQFRAELELAYKTADIDQVTLDFDDGEVELDDVDGDINIWSVMGNALWNPSFGDRWSAYLGGGAGWAWTSFEDDGDELKDNAFAWQLIAGIGYQLSDNIELGLKYRYFQTKLSDEDEDVFQDGSVDVDIDGKIRSHSVLASLIFSFGSAPPPPPPPPPPATQTCPDGSVILATDMCPPPPPPPPPPPEPERG